METQFPLVECEGNSLFSPLPQFPFVTSCEPAEGSDTHDRELVLCCTLVSGPRRRPRLGFQDARAQGPWGDFPARG